MVAKTEFEIKYELRRSGIERLQSDMSICGRHWYFFPDPNSDNIGAINFLNRSKIRNFPEVWVTQVVLIPVYMTTGPDLIDVQRMLDIPFGLENG